MLFIDYSSAFNTIVPSKLVIKLETLGLDPALCNWVLDFLTGRPQVVRVGNNISSPLILNTGAPQGCVLSPLLYSLFTHDCVAMHASNSIIKFADDTTVVGLITNNDETAYREEVRALGVWCQENNLTLNVNKTKEMIVDFRKQQREHTPPIHIDGTVVERVASFKFLGIHITDKLNWSTHTDSIVRKAQQRLFNLRRLKKFGLSPKALTNFYRCTIESILAGCITAWYGNCTALNRKALQRVVRSAQRITGGKLPALQDTYTTRCYRKAIKIIKDINHPSHCLFTPLSSRRRVIRAKVVGKEAVSNAIKYDIQQIKMFKGCDQVIHAIYTYTTSCSVTLEINKEYLFTGKLKTGRMSITLCGYNPPWEDLSAAQKNSLTHLYQSGCDCKIIRCTSLPCPISTSDTCLWTDWGTDNGQNLACIKRPDGSCAW
uniref:Metalloproteinase inhibitor 2 n=1 Tax=Oncorhynchus tshawytscha TaxID=74940 RepID=A0A8C8I2H8_ONCTS